LYPAHMSLFPAEDHIPPVSERELALSMMRLWGKDARGSARNYVLESCRKDDAAAFRKWHSVERIIEQMQAARGPGADTVCGVQRPVATDRRAGWFKAMAGVVMPALQRLGRAAIRGAGP
jgi:hypothetical protein